MANAAAIEGVHFLTQSPVRIRILELLYDVGGLQQRELKDRVDASRVTVRRNLHALDERGLLTITDRTCELTPLGELVVEDVLPVVETADVIDRLQPIVRWFPEDELDFDLRALADATVVESTATDPYAPVNRHIEVMESAERFRCLLPAVGLPAMITARDRVVEHGSQYEFVYSDDLAPTLRDQPEYRELVEELADAPTCDLFRADRTIRYYLGLFRQHVQIGVEDAEGKPQALVETDADEVRAWGERTYERYLDRAEPFAP